MFHDVISFLKDSSKTVSLINLKSDSQHPCGEKENPSGSEAAILDFNVTEVMNVTAFSGAPTLTECTSFVL